ncbi:MAG: glycosyltransferase, partial [Acidimicrobiaceae bacterium]|nr:glycosyltransferase [Acidimicrobiaceae bacterium]
YLEVLGLADRPIGTGYDCVDNQRIARAARDARERGLRLAGTEDYFLCVSRMVGVKNLPFLISTYRRYRDSLPEGIRPWKLVLCGDGPARREIEEAVARNRVTGDVLAGVVTDPAVMANYYAFANVAILPSAAAEPWGLVVNEAMAASLPVLVSKRCGSAPHLVDEAQNGFTFDPTDGTGLAALMQWMHYNRDRLPTMGERSAELVQNYSPERFGESVVSLEAEAMRVRRQRVHG